MYDFESRKTNKGSKMSRILVVTVALLAALSVSACAGKGPPLGKGKAPPPVVTKG
jgi:hypothetical protein